MTKASCICPQGLANATNSVDAHGNFLLQGRLAADCGLASTARGLPVTTCWSILRCTIILKCPSQALACARTRARTHARMHVCTYARARTCTHTHKCTHLRAHTDTQTHRHAHPHTHSVCVSARESACAWFGVN